MSRWCIAIALGGTLGLCGCEERRVVSARGGLEGIPGATGGYSDQTEQKVSGRTFESILADPEADEAAYDTSDEHNAGYLRVYDDEQNIRLISRSPRHLIYHLNTTLVNGEEDLLYDQLLSNKTKRAYEERGLDPREALRWLARNRSAINELLMTLPAGEATPGVLQETIGPNEFRLRSPSAHAMKLPFDTIDVIIEDRSFKLLMIR